MDSMKPPSRLLASYTVIDAAGPNCFLHQPATRGKDAPHTVYSSRHAPEKVGMCQSRQSATEDGDSGRHHFAWHRNRSGSGCVCGRACVWRSWCRAAGGYCTRSYLEMGGRILASGAAWLVGTMAARPGPDSKGGQSSAAVEHPDARPSPGKRPRLLVSACWLPCMRTLGCLPSAT